MSPDMCGDRAAEHVHTNAPGKKVSIFIQGEKKASGACKHVWRSEGRIEIHLDDGTTIKLREKKLVVTHGQPLIIANW